VVVIFDVIILAAVDTKSQLRGCRLDPCAGCDCPDGDRARKYDTGDPVDEDSAADRITGSTL